MPCSNVAEQQLRRTLGDHGYRRIRVAADQGRHDRRIDDTQSLDATHAQLAVDNGGLVVPHAAAADRVIDRFGLAADKGDEIRIALRIRAGEDLIAAIRRERSCARISRDRRAPSIIMRRSCPSVSLR